MKKELFTMNIGKQIELYKELNTNSIQKIKQLNQSERKEVFVALRALQNNENLSLTYQYSCNLDPLILKLKSSTQPIVYSPSNLILRIIKGIFNLLFRYGSDLILKEAAKVSSLKDELERLPLQIQDKQSQLVEWKEMVRFNEHDAAPLYQDIATFYSQLPKDLENARPLLAKKCVEISDLVAQAKKGIHDEGYIKILEKEILKSLIGLRDYKKNNFEVELDTSIKVFNGAINFASSQETKKLASKEIKKLETEVSKLLKRKSELEHKPIAKLIIKKAK